MKKPKIEYFNRELVKLLQEQTKLSPSTLHKIMNPFCGICMAERGQHFLEENSTK